MVFFLVFGVCGGGALCSSVVLVCVSEHKKLKHQKRVFYMVIFSLLSLHSSLFFLYYCVWIFSSFAEHVATLCRPGGKRRFLVVFSRSQFAQ